MPKVAYVKLSYELLEEIELEGDTTVGETKVKALDHMQQITKFAANDLLDATRMEYYPGRWYTVPRIPLGVSLN